MNRDERTALDNLVKAAKDVDATNLESDSDDTDLTAVDMRRRNGLDNSTPGEPSHR
jgi:hypothetical protein